METKETEMFLSVSANSYRAAFPMRPGKIHLKLEPINRSKIKKGKKMNDENRVLIRKGARALSAEEIECVGGGIGTTTLCTVPTTACPNKDGDASIGECGPHC
jgi:hypothetical protein